MHNPSILPALALAAALAVAPSTASANCPFCDTPDARPALVLLGAATVAGAFVALAIGAAAAARRADPVTASTGPARPGCNLAVVDGGAIATYSGRF